MRRSAPIAAVLVIAVVAATSAGAGDAPNRVSATANETDETHMTLILSRPKIDPGDAKIEFRNDGEDDHDLKIKRVGSEGETSVGVLHHDEVDEVELRLKRGAKYRFWCSLQDGLHREYGMEATLRVRNHRS